MQCTFGIRNAPLVLGMVVQHVHHPQKQETSLQGTASGAIQTEEVRHMLSAGNGTSVRQPEKMRSHPLHDTAEREMLQAVRGFLVIAKHASSLLLESAKSGPTIEQGVQ